MKSFKLLKFEHNCLKQNDIVEMRERDERFKNDIFVESTEQWLYSWLHDFSTGQTNKKHTSRTKRQCAT